MTTVDPIFEHIHYSQLKSGGGCNHPISGLGFVPNTKISIIGSSTTTSTTSSDCKNISNSNGNKPDRNNHLECQNAPSHRGNPVIFSWSASATDADDHTPPSGCKGGPHGKMHREGGGEEGVIVGNALAIHDLLGA